MWETPHYFTASALRNLRSSQAARMEVYHSTLSFTAQVRTGQSQNWPLSAHCRCSVAQFALTTGVRWMVAAAAGSCTAAAGCCLGCLNRPLFCLAGVLLAREPSCSRKQTSQSLHRHGKQTLNAETACCSVLIICHQPDTGILKTSQAYFSTRQTIGPCKKVKQSVHGV